MKLKISLILFLVLIVVANLAYAGDMLSSFMSKDQDYMVVGKTTNKKDQQYTIEVSELIIASGNKTDISKTVVVTLPKMNFSIGDGIVVSLDAYVGGYKLKNGAYKLTTNDTDTLEVIPISETQDTSDIVAIEVFLRSRGKIKNFAFISNSQVFISDNSNHMISIYDIETGKRIPLQMEKNEKYSIKETSKVIPIIITFIVVGVMLAIGINSYYKNKKTNLPS